MTENTGNIDLFQPKMWTYQKYCSPGLQVDEFYSIIFVVYFCCILYLRFIIDMKTDEESGNEIDMFRIRNTPYCIDTYEQSEEKYEKLFIFYFINFVQVLNCEELYY